MTGSDIIRIACWRYNHELDMASADLATAITDVPSLPTTLLNFYQAVIVHGGSLAELAPLYKYSAFVTDVKEALATSDISMLTALVAVANELSPIGDQTLSAITATMTAQRLVDAVAADYPDDNITMPATITAAMVDEALGR